jgi:glutamyl-tRNA reductase
MPLAGVPATVLGATGPVGLRAAELLAAEGAQVTLVSRTMERAQAAAEAVRSRVASAVVLAGAATDPQENETLCQGAAVVVAAGAAGAVLLPSGALQRLSGLRLAIDLNAVPPLGLSDVSAMDKGVTHHGVLCYGALGVGGLKMKVHRQCVASLFESSDRLLDTQAIYQVARRTAGIAEQ